MRQKQAHHLGMRHHSLQLGLHPHPIHLVPQKRTPSYVDARHVASGECGLGWFDGHGACGY
jgi:hypothetical protein